MDSQVQSFKQLADLITSDLVDRLQLPSGSSAAKIISEDLRRVASTSNTLSTGIAKLDDRLKSSSSGSTTVLDFVRKDLTNLVKHIPNLAGELSNLAKVSTGVVANVAKLNDTLKLSIAASKETNPSADLSVEETNQPSSDVKPSIVETVQESALVDRSIQQPTPQLNVDAIEKTLQRLIEVTSSSQANSVTTPQDSLNQVPVDIAPISSAAAVSTNPEISSVEGISGTEQVLGLVESLLKELKSLTNLVDKITDPSSTISKESVEESAVAPTITATIEESTVAPTITSSTREESAAPQRTSVEETNTDLPKEEGPSLIQSLIKQLEAFIKASREQSLSSSGAKPKSELMAVDKPEEAIITGFSEQALKGLSLPALVDGFKDISKTLHDIEGGITNLPGKGEGDGDADGGGLFAGFFAKLKPILPVLGGAAVLLAGVGSLVAAFNTDDETKGTLELIGKGGVKAGLSIIAKKVGEKAAKAIKFIPLIGSVISMGFAFQRFSNGDTIGGILEIGSALAGLIPVPGVGLAISTGIDVLQAVLDAKAGGSSAEASAKKGDILLDWAKKIGTFVDEKIKYVPIIGPLYETGRALLKGDWKQAFLEFITVIPALQAVKFIMGEEQFNAKVEEVASPIGNWLKGIGEFIDEKISYIPLLGPLYNTGKALLKGDWKRALFEFATINPALQFAKAFMTEDEIQQASEGIAFNVKEWLSKVGNWIYEKTENLPIIGPLVKAAKKAIDDPLAFMEALPGGQALISMFASVNDGDYVEAFKFGTDAFAGVAEWTRNKIKELPVIGPLMEAIKTSTSISEFVGKIPGGTALLDLLDFATSGKVIETATGAVSNLFKNVVDWIEEKLSDLPVIGPLIKAIRNAVNDPMEFLKSVPGGGLIISFIEGAKELAGSAMDAASNIASSMGNKITGLFSSIADSIKEALLNLIPEKMGVGMISIDLRRRVKEYLGVKDNSSSSTVGSEQLASKTAPSSTANNQMGASTPSVPASDTVKQVQDSAIDPAGGLIISSPQLGSLYQINKNDGIVSGPAASGNLRKEENNFGKMESLLEKVVTNTFVTNQNISNLISGFNRMAKALQEKIGEDLSVPVVMNQPTQKSSSPSFTQYANVGNGEISNFRAGIIEGSRFQPA